MTPTHPGLDLDVLGRWLPDHLPGAGSQLSASLIAGGKSNLTYRLTDQSSTWILRRPPVGELMATAHDMAREYRMMSALADTAVPVPQMYLLCEDPDVLGAPFYLMSEVQGIPYRRAAELSALGAARTQQIAERLVDTLATLHRVDPAEVGLGGFGRPEGFLGRQVKRWHQQFEASHTQPRPLADELYAALQDRVPADAAPGIVHGDFRLDNVLIDAQDQPVAVLDWELATIGDSLTDLALMLVYARMAAHFPHAVSDVSAAPGYPSEQQIIERYARASDRDLSSLNFCIALASFKLAGILQGVHYRHLNGQTVGEGFAGAGEVVDPLLTAGLHALEED